MREPWFPWKIEMLLLPEVADELLSDFPPNSNHSFLPRKMSQFFGSTNAPALRRCAARINGMPCGQVCQSPMSLFCNEHIPGFVTLPQQQTYGRCTHFNSAGRVCQNDIVSPNTPFCPQHRPAFMAPTMPTCTYTENGMRCANAAAVVPSNYGHSFIGVPSPLCEAHSLPHIYNHFGFAVPPPPQIQQLARPIASENNNKTAAELHQCSICTEDIVVADHSCSLRCKHTFHGKCLNQWFIARNREAMNPSCPNCRAAITQRDEQKVSLAALNQEEDEQYDADGVFINNGPVNFNYVPDNIPNGDVFFRGHVFHVQADSDEEDPESYEDDGFDYTAPRNLLPEFDRVALADADVNFSSSSSAPSIAQ